MENQTVSFKQARLARNGRHYGEGQPPFRAGEQKGNSLKYEYIGLLMALATFASLSACHSQMDLRGGTCQMFEHLYFDVYPFDDIPLDRDCFLMDETYIEEYEKSLLSVFSGGDCEPIGYISYASVRRIRDTSLELSWYPVLDRFHEVVITLPQK